MNFDILEDNLSASHLSLVLEAFGLTPAFAKDHEGYMCESRANCVIAAAYICMSTC